jgi:hydroxyethylthiazole kinase
MEAHAIWRDLMAIREKSPLIHNITNYVVMNSTANALLALGASPVMAHAAEEVEEMVALVATVGGALVINIGTLSPPWIASMSLAMAAAKKHNAPIVFDPVGAGATALRTETCRKLINEVPPTIIRGNASEIMALHSSDIRTKGVESSSASSVAVESAQALAREFGCVVCVSGATDMITDGNALNTVANGHALMTKVTGMGCTATALIGAFAAVNPQPLEAATHAMSVMGIAGELAAQKAEGPGTLQLYFYDALYTLTETLIKGRLK